MAMISSVKNISAIQKHDFLGKLVLEIIEDILPHINQDKIDLLKSNICYNEALELNFYSNNNKCCPVFISCESNSITILIGIGEVIYLNNSSVFSKNDIVNLKACIEDLFYLPIGETVFFKKSKIISSKCLINQEINGMTTTVKYEHIHHFSILPIGEKKKIYEYISWAER